MNVHVITELAGEIEHQPSPYIPRSVEEHKARFPAIVADVHDAYDLETKRKLATDFCLDFDDGIRLVICRFVSSPDEILISASIKPGSILHHMSRSERPHINLLKTMADRYREISGYNQPIAFEGISSTGVAFFVAPSHLQND